MRSIIEEFYLGNLMPDGTAVRHASDLEQAMQEAAKEEEFLREHLGGECLVALERMLSARLLSTSYTAQERYADGFRTGAKFMLDILEGHDENLVPLGRI